MNYDVTAKKVASDHFAREQRGECPIAGKLVSDIAAALRRAANEAAWKGYEAGREFERSMTSKQAMAFKHELTAKYGPKEARDE